MKFAERLREAREKVGISGPDAAKEVGVSRNYIYDLEKAIKKPSLDLVFKLAQLYKDGSLISEFIEHNQMFDGKLSFLYELMSKLPADELNYRLDRFKRILDAIESSQNAKDEYYDFVEKFLDKYEKPDAK